jgi:cell division protein FtsB
VVPLQGSALQDLAAQMKGQLQPLNDQIASKQQELQVLLAQKQALAASIADLKAYIQSQGG